MSPRALLSPLALLTLLACGGSTSKGPAPATDGSSTPAASPGAAAAPAEALPPGAFPPLPGWLGFTTAPAAERGHPWTPSHPNAKAVIFDPKGWEELSEGTAFEAATLQGPLSLKYSELSEIPYGCDETPTVMVAFQGPYDFEEQAIWILPAGMKGAKAAAPVSGPASAEARSWTVGEFTVKVARTDALHGTWEVLRGGASVHQAPFERGVMDGDESPELDLSEDVAVGAPAPLAAFTLKEGMPPVLVMRTQGYEGTNVEVFTVDKGKLVSVGSAYLYQCAF
ncbi:MAG: hypothetical protein H6740_25830 [Alphaproteobacteria bacterium]|nr:hypothetical protein [Alphaproteobacteria bacterium]